MSEKARDLGGKIRNASHEVREDTKFDDGKRNMVTLYLGGGQASKYQEMFAEGLANLRSALDTYKDSPTGVKLTFHFGTTKFANGSKGTTGYFFVAPVQVVGAAKEPVVVESTADKIDKLTSESA